MSSCPTRKRTSRPATNNPPPQTINTHFSNPIIPIAALRPLTNDTFHDTRHYRLGEYASKVAHIPNFPRALRNATSTPGPVDLYRQTLAAAATKNACITLVSIGFLTNLAALLESGPDAISPLTGHELVEQKVAELVVMGGRYPAGLEFNFAFDVASTRTVLAQWPDNVPVTFSGYELGSKIFSGQNLPTLAEEGSPVLAAYQWYGDRCDTRRASYDPVTVLYAVTGLGEMFEFEGEGGWNEVGEDGRNWWAWGEDREGNGKKQRWLKLKDGMSGEDVGGVLERLYVRGSLEEECCLGLGACDGSMKAQFPLNV